MQHFWKKHRSTSYLLSLHSFKIFSRGTINPPRLKPREETVVSSKYIGQTKSQQNPPSKQIPKTEKEYIILNKASVVKEQNRDIWCTSLTDTFFEESRWNYRDLGFIYAMPLACQTALGKSVQSQLCWRKPRIAQYCRYSCIRLKSDLLIWYSAY